MNNGIGKNLIRVHEILLLDAEIFRFIEFTILLRGVLDKRFPCEHIAKRRGSTRRKKCKQLPANTTIRDQSRRWRREIKGS